MRPTSRMVLASLVTVAALGLGSVAFAAPAHADIAADVTANTATADAALVNAIRALPVDESEPDADQKKWKGGAAFDPDTAKWRPFIRNGDMVVLLTGQYENRDHAVAAGKGKAKALNDGFMAHPDCKPPVLC